MISFFRRLVRDRRGNMLVLAGAALPMLVGAAGLATDTIQWAMWKRQLQRAADSSAIAGVYHLNGGGTDGELVDVVDHDLELNHHTGIDWVNDPDVDFLGDDGDMESRVRVVLTIRKPLPFSSMFMTAAPIITASATAASVPGGDEYCVLTLENRANRTGITIGGSTIIEMDCGMISNSPAVNSALSNGNASRVIASVIAAVGGVQQSTNWQVEEYDPYADAAEDPYASIDPTATEMSGCASSPPALTATTTVAATGDLCVSSITIASGASKNLTPTTGTRTIYVTGRNANTTGDVVLHGNLTCTGCTIVLTNKDMSSTAKIGTFDMQAQSSLNITAPSGATDKYRGIAVFQDRRATDRNGASPNKFNGGGAQSIVGALYFPSQEVTYNGNGTATATCTRFVTRRIIFTGNSATSNKFERGSNCPVFGNEGIGGGRRVRLVA